MGKALLALVASLAAVVPVISVRDPWLVRRLVTGAVSGVVTETEKKRYAQYLSERLWRRLGAPTAHVWLDHEGGLARTACCLFTTARAWLRVGRLILDQRRVGDEHVIREAWIRAMTAPSQANPNYGLRVWLGSPPGKERNYNDKTVKAFHGSRLRPRT